MGITYRNWKDVLCDIALISKSGTYAFHLQWRNDHFHFISFGVLKQLFVLEQLYIKGKIAIKPNQILKGIIQQELHFHLHLFDPSQTCEYLSTYVTETHTGHTHCFFAFASCINTSNSWTRNSTTLRIFSLHVTALKSILMYWFGSYRRTSYIIDIRQHTTGQVIAISSQYFSGYDDDTNNERRRIYTELTTNECAI